MEARAIGFRPGVGRSVHQRPQNGTSDTRAWRLAKRHWPQAFDVVHSACRNREPSMTLWRQRFRIKHSSISPGRRRASTATKDIDSGDGLCVNGTPEYVRSSTRMTASFASFPPYRCHVGDLTIGGDKNYPFGGHSNMSAIRQAQKLPIRVTSGDGHFETLGREVGI